MNNFALILIIKPKLFTTFIYEKNLLLNHLYRFSLLLDLFLFIRSLQLKFIWYLGQTNIISCSSEIQWKRVRPGERLNKIIFVAKGLGGT